MKKLNENSKSILFIKKIKLFGEKIVLKGLNFETIFAAFLSAFAFTSLYSIIITPGFFYELDFVIGVNKLLFITMFILLLMFLLTLTYSLNKKWIIPASLLFSSLGLSIIIVLSQSEDIYLNLALALILGFIIYWICRDDKLNLSKLKISNRFSFYYALGGFLIFTFFFSYISIIRYQGYAASAFDFGVFAQMFEYMKNTGIPNTTVERDVLLSHFGVHFSPIFYLMLPGYMLFSSPEYLLIIQALFVAAGVFAIRGICKTLKISPKLTVLIMTIYLLYPSMGSGLLFDFHENKFLTTLILTLIYFILNKKTLWIFIVSLLILMVKEDAAIYVVAIGLYRIFARKEYSEGILMCIMSVIYFIIAVYIVAKVGDGVMIDRLANYMPEGEGSGFGVVIKTLFFNFPYLITSIFKTDRIIFLLWALLPLMFLPILTKKISTLVLLIPMLVINLMPDWIYQYDINYQYTYGSLALLIFLFILVIKEYKSKDQLKILLTCTAISIIVFTSLNYNRFKYYIDNYYSNTNNIKLSNECLNSIPDNKIISATTFFVPKLYQHKELYLASTDHYNQNIDFFVLSKDDDDFADLLFEYQKAGFNMYCKAGFVEVYQRPFTQY